MPLAAAAAAVAGNGDGRRFADVKISDAQLVDLVSDSSGHYVYALDSSRVSIAYSFLLEMIDASARVGPSFNLI